MEGNEQDIGGAAAGWSLAAIVEVDHADRIQCQCKGCGQTVFRRVHVILFPSGDIECWGSTCYERELGSHRGKVEPLYSSAAGRRLTEQEREWLKSNRDRLIAEFREQRERHLLDAAESAERARAASERAAAEAEEQIAQTARAFEESRRARSLAIPQSSTPLARNAVPRLPDLEPLNDPLYREIRERLAARWAEQRIDIERPGQKAMFLENVRAEYARIRRSR